MQGVYNHCTCIHVLNAVGEQWERESRRLCVNVDARRVQSLYTCIKISMRTEWECRETVCQCWWKVGTIIVQSASTAPSWCGVFLSESLRQGLITVKGWLSSGSYLCFLIPVQVVLTVRVVWREGCLPGRVDVPVSVLLSLSLDKFASIQTRDSVSLVSFLNFCHCCEWT